MSHRELKLLDDLDDVLIVQQIKRQDSAVASNNSSFEAIHCLCHESGCDCERNYLVEVQEAIVKKQLQMLQADERGKQALKSEITALKEKQNSRAEFLRHRQRALDIEKERAQKIASLPPPLPKSVRLLLQKNDNEPKLSKPDVQMPDELTTFTIKPIEICSKDSENKENIISQEELEAKQKMREERDMIAKKRYHEALKKDRQKEEYSKIMKQIQNAELFNRQEMAKNISSDMKSVPCPLSDKFQTAKKQVDMENVAEKIFKRSGAKEHIIEDIEGYQDHYEEKYKRIDSNYETKMFDCVPSFVKDNYDYLLEDESKFVGGKNFSGLDDSSNDVLNQAYIETPPSANELNGTGEIDYVISHLDKLRSNLETEYEQNVKPLLIAATEIPKKELKDKAVETEFEPKPSEDKAVETDAEFKNNLTSPPNTTIFNFTNAGVMAFKRRPHLPTLRTYENLYLTDMHQRDVHYVVPLVSESKDSVESWSPSTYCSLPSKHGIPIIPNGSGPTKCEICIAEMKENQVKDNFIQESTPMSAVFNKESNENLITSSKKSPLSQCVEKLVKKYLVPKSPTNCMQNESSVQSFSDSSASNYSNTKTKNPAFVKEVIGKSKVGVFSESDKCENFSAVPVKNALSEEENKFQFPPFLKESFPTEKEKTSIKMGDAENEMLKSEEFVDDIYLKLKDNELPKNLNECSDYDYEAKRIQTIQQILSRNSPQFVLGNDKSNENKDKKEENQFNFPVRNIMAEPYIYHELSTIHEIDSALYASSLQFSQSKLSDTSREKQVPLEEKLKKLNQSAESLKVVSLLDSSGAKMTEFANDINFVSENVKEINHNEETSVTDLTNFHNDKSVSSKEHLSTPILTPSSYSSVLTPGCTPSVPPSSSTHSVLSERSGEKNIHNSIMSGYVSELDIQIQDMTQSEVLHPNNDSDESSKPMTPCSNVSPPSDLATLTSRKDLQDVTIAENLPPKPLFSNTSLQIPNVSTSDVHHISQAPSIEFSSHALKKDPKDKDSVRSLKLMTPHSYISSPSDLATHILRKDFQDVIIGRSLSPMPLFSNASSQLPSVSTSDVHYLRQASSIKCDDFALRKNPKDQDSVQSLKLMTPHSYVSSPSDLAIHTLSKDFKDVNIAGSLIPMPLFSNTSPQIPSISSSDVQYLGQASSIKCDGLALRKNYKDNVSIQSLKPMTPHSYVSSPSDLAIHTLRKNFQDINIAGSLTPRPLFSNTSSQMPIESTSDMHHVGQASPIEFHGHALKKDFKDDYSVPSFKHMTPHSYISSPSDLATHTLGKYLQDVNIAGSLTPLPLFSNPSLPNKSAFVKESIQDDTIQKNKENLEKLAEENKFDSDSTTSSKETSNEVSEKGNVIIKSKEMYKTQAQFENGKNSRNQLCDLLALSSASSSTENLSVISRSKVVCQSTPIKIKTMTELLQEPGILEEPNFTLITTKLNSELDTTELIKGPLISVTDENKEKPCVAGSSQNECLTPPCNSPNPFSPTDTPSMISFLQHEASSWQSENNTVQSPKDDTIAKQNTPKSNASPLKEVKRSLFQKASYKQRTKRLYNNLEEVKKIRMAADRKKQMELNRMKAKQFAKTLTPKQKKN